MEEYLTAKANKSKKEGEILKKKLSIPSLLRLPRLRGLFLRVFVQSTMRAAGAALLFGFLLASCASAPRVQEEEAAPPNIFSGLPAGAQVYFYADVKKARPILELVEFGGMSGASAGVILDRTGTAVAALYDEESGRRYMALGSGSYPSLRSSIAFVFSRAWRKRKSETGGTYWRNSGEGISVLIKKDWALVSDGEPYFTQASLEPSPRWFSLEGGAALSGVAENAGERVSAFFDGLGLPIQFPAERLVFGLYPAAGGPPAEEARYTALFYIETPTVSHARSVQSMISLARRVFSTIEADADPQTAAMGALFANVPRLEEGTVIISTGPMTAEGIALLFNSFSVYSE
jgi:hypothetical protein